MLRWADLVFHVLAHVRASDGLAASVYDPVYVRFAERLLGPASKRMLQDDAAVLGKLLATHDELARAQLAAWLFRDEHEALACAERDLADLGEAEVADGGALRALVRLGPRAEVLRAAALLELPAWSRLPPVSFDAVALAGALRAVEPAAPLLRRCQVCCVRALRLRGRVRGRRIWVGAPSADPGPTSEHAAWQAAHEASVLEVSEACARERRDLGHRGLEHAAVVLLAERASDTALVEPHARWLSHLGANAPPLVRSSLGEAAAAVLERCAPRALRSGT